MPKNPRVAVGLVYGGIEPDFMFSLLALKDWDTRHRGLLDHPGWLIANGGTNLPQQRNNVVRAFLETDAEWLWFVDTDQRFRFDILDQLMDSADPKERPIMSALVMAEKFNPRHRIVPACMGFESIDPPIPREYATIPAEQHWQVGAIGSGCVVIHRTVFEKMHAANPTDAQPWFKYVQWDHDDDKTGKTVHDIMGEDYVFSLRAQAIGFPVYVDTTIEAGHIKKRTLTSKDFWPSVPPQHIPVKNFIVIPIKDNLKDTRNLVTALAEQGQHHGILIIDNGSNPETRKWLDRQTYAKVARMDDAGIHQMWNAGIEWATAQHPRFNLAILNNDLKIGDNFIDGLAEALRTDDQLVAVCPNYDSREMGQPLEQLNGICADRYDGTGGLAGFAFMVKSEWFAQGWRFPEDCRWWFGDNDFTLSVDLAGGWYAMVRDVTVEHLDGGGKTGKWDDPAIQPQLVADKAAFTRRWAARGIRVA